MMVKKKKKKKMWVKNNIVYDPNIDYDPFDTESSDAKKVYKKGKKKRTEYFGI